MRKNYAAGALLFVMTIAVNSAAIAEEPPAASDKVATTAPAHRVVHYSDVTALQPPSGKAKVSRFAGAEEGARHAFFAMLEISAGAKVPVHRDATEEYIYMLSGAGKITIDGTIHEVGEGHGIFMPAGAEVSFEVTGTEPVRAIQFFAGQGPESKYKTWADAE